MIDDTHDNHIFNSDDDNIDGEDNDDVQVEQHYTHTEFFSGWTFFYR